MNIILSVLWAALAVVWLSCISFIARLVGGYQWLVDTGQTRQVLMLTAVAVLCILAAVTYLLKKPLNKSLSIVISVAVGIHLVNAIGFFIMVSTNGRAGAALLPFMLIASIIPTETQFVGIPPGNFSIFILPVSTLVLWLISVSFVRASSDELTKDA